MKNFLVFMAMLIINLSFLTFRSDMNRCIRMQARIEKFAAECAMGATQILNPEAYSLGDMDCELEAAQSYVEYMVEKFNKSDTLAGRGRLSAVLDIAEAGEGITVEVTVNYSGQDMFRLPFLHLSTFEKTGVYTSNPWEL